MTPEQSILEEVREGIDQLTPAARDATLAVANRLRTMLQAEPVHGPLALALVGAEMACMGEEVAAAFPAFSNLPRC